jgi:hypothetical protein
MTDEEKMVDSETAAIELTRRLTRKLLAEVTGRGIEPADATIALAYALHDAATELTGGHRAGWAWMRDAVLIMERQLTAASD